MLLFVKFKAKIYDALEVEAEPPAEGLAPLLLGEEVVHSADLIALEPVEEGGFFRRLWDSIRLFFYGMFN